MSDMQFLQAAQATVLDSPTRLVSPFAVHPPDAILNLPEGCHLDQLVSLGEGRQHSIDPTLRSMSLDASFVVRMVSAHTGASTLTDNSYPNSSRDPLHISMGISDAGPKSSELLPMLPEDFLRAASLASLSDDGLPVVCLDPLPSQTAAPSLRPPTHKRAASRRIGDHDSFEFTQPPMKLTASASTLLASHAGLHALHISDKAAPSADLPTVDTAAGRCDAAATSACAAGMPHRPVGWNPRLQSSLDLNRQRRGNRRSIASLDEAATAAGVTAALAAVAISSSCVGGAGHDVLDQGGACDSLESRLEDDILAEARLWLP